jgi:hypothetical protein
MSRFRWVSTALVVFLLMSLVLTTPGCISTPKKSAMMKDAKNLQDMTSAELRLKVYAFAGLFEGTVAGAADLIMDKTDDPATRRNALAWKLYAIPEVQKAAFHYDPLAGLIDVVALCGQMKAFLGPGGGGEDLFGEWQGIAVKASSMLDDEVWALGTSLTVSGDVTEVRQNVAEWVTENPINDVTMVRKSTRELSAKLATETGSGAAAAIGGITDTVSDLSDRLTIYAASLPMQARWQAQMLVYDMLEEAELENLGSTTESLADSIDRIASTVELTPDLAVRERAKTLDELDAIAQAMIDAIDRQRMATIDAVAAERIAVLAAVERERIAILDTIREERAATVSEGGAVLEVLVQDSFDRAEGLIEQIFWKAAILLAFSGVGLLVIGLIVVRNYRARIIQE